MKVLRSLMQVKLAFSGATEGHRNNDSRSIAINEQVHFYREARLLR